jgi:hypothetical protein
MTTSRYISLLLTLIPAFTQAQPLPVEIVSDTAHHTVIVTAGGIPFTTFIYPDTLEKPVLYPIYAPDGQLITRGFPLQPARVTPPTIPITSDFGLIMKM